eukprot:COSAG02_NODE_139_length_34376_cov_233.853663_18_plen_62_part_00
MTKSIVRPTIVGGVPSACGGCNSAAYPVPTAIVGTMAILSLRDTVIASRKKALSGRVTAPL